MKIIVKKFVAILCAVCMLASGCGDMGLPSSAEGDPVVLTRELTASDENTYRITVACAPESGVPGNTELRVRELEAEDADGYVEQSARLLGRTPEAMDYARAFDISLHDPDSGAELQPEAGVQVSIRLMDVEPGGEEDLRVVHFAALPETAEAEVPVGAAEALGLPVLLEAETEGDTVTFETESFSVYVILRPDGVPRMTYTFLYWDRTDGVYKTYAFDTDHGTAYSQTVKKGETPRVPQLPSDAGRTFRGWYAGAYDGPNLILSDTPYDFRNIPDFTEDGAVDLYALYTEYVYAVFRDQYDPEAGTFPVAFTRRGELTGSPAQAELRIDDLSTTYNGGTEEAGLAFYGWSYTPVSVPNAERDDNGDPVSRIEDPTVVITETTDLYPLFRPVRWLSFYSGPAHSGASYVPPAYYFDQEGCASLPVPERPGYHFAGWYTGSLSSGPDGETVTFGARITLADGTPAPGVDDGGVYVLDGRLYLRADAMLYALWEEDPDAGYRVVVWTQDPGNAFGLPTEERTYVYAEVQHLTAAVGSMAAVPEEAVGRDYPGYFYSRCDAPAPVERDGSTVLNVYYDLAGPYTPSGETHTLTFTDSETGSPSPDLPAERYGLAWGDSLAGLIPDAPASGRAGYTFLGWFMDPDCTVPAAPETMPDRHLTLYAGWQSIKYQVRIDPNYGTLRGTGATWFSNRYDDDPIQEYIQVTREYVESSSGTWYYVKHDLDYYNGDPPAGANREAWYTQDPGEATEYATFAYAPDYYRYAGWYEVHPDGTETRYEFGHPVDHDTTLKLHWKKLGLYYLEYVPAAEQDGAVLTGTLDAGDGNEALFAALDGAAYADNADVVVTRSALPPEGYAFEGWRLRGDPDGTVYRPGSIFTLKASRAVTVSGRNVVYLDAVYSRLPTAKVIYDPNGGTASPDADLGAPVGEDLPLPVYSHEGNPSIGGLVNNSALRLSDGTGFTRAGAVLLGWSDRPVLTGDAPLFAPGSVCGVDAEEPTVLYAVWGVRTYWHLNRTGAEWGGAWEGWQDASEGVKSRLVPLDTPVEQPADAPLCPGDDSLMFRAWRTAAYAPGTAPDDGDVWDFSLPVTEETHLYAYWAGPLEVPVHALDASGEDLELRDGSWLPAEARLEVGAAPAVLTETLAAEACLGGAAPEGFVYAFTAAHDAALGLDAVSGEEAVTAVYYNVREGRLYVDYASPDRADAPLEEGMALYFVWYRVKTLPVSWRAMDTDGALVERTPDPAAPGDTGPLGECAADGLLTAPLAWNTEGADGFYAYALGAPGTGEASALCLITDASDSDANRPGLLLRNTWRGFQYSLNGGGSWTSCGYDLQLYVLYFRHRPSIITIRERTLGTRTVSGQSFSYTALVEDPAGPDHTLSFTLHSGEAKTIAAYSWTDGEGDLRVQRVTVTQEAREDFETLTADALGETATTEWSFSADDPDPAPAVTFLNRHRGLTVEIHAAMLTDAGIVPADEWRSAEPERYRFTLALEETAVLTHRLPAESLFTGDRNIYAFGGVVWGRVRDGALSVRSLEGAAAAYGPAGEDGYELLLLDGSGQVLGEPEEDSLWYLYYPMPRLRYVRLGADGTLTPIRGSRDGAAVTEDVTYGGELLTMNGETVCQDQPLRVPPEGLLISQDGGSRSFRMPPILDDGTYRRYLDYTAAAVGIAGAASVGELTSGGGGSLRLQLRDSALEYSLDGTAWSPLPQGGVPTVYALYAERGYDLLITNTVDVSVSGADPIFTEREFTVTLVSPAITRTRYAAEGGDVTGVDAVPAAEGEPGRIVLRLRDGDSLRIRGLGRGEYTLTESGQDNFDLTAKTGPILGAAPVSAEVEDNRTLRLTLDTEKRADLVNTPAAICKIDEEGAERLFYTLSQAVRYVDEEIPGRSGVIRMLRDYLMPARDAAAVPAGCAVTLTTAASGSHVYEGSGTASILRSPALCEAPLLTAYGALTLENVTLDGSGLSAGAPLIRSEGPLTLGSGALLRAARNSGDGGAVLALGDVTIRDGAVSGCSAARGGGVCSLGGGTLTLSGTAAVTGCSALGSGATQALGGGIYMESGAVDLTDTARISGCGAENGMGGGVYAATAVVRISLSASIAGNRAAEGGGVCTAEGAVNVAGGSISGNAAGTGSGGGVYTAAGRVTVSGGSITANRAPGGMGGGVYAESGTVSVTGGVVGGTGTGNSAVNGAAVFVRSGAAEFSGGSVTGNSASAGGAVGVGSGSARLYFSGSAFVDGNTMGAEASNVYLDVNEDMVVNAAGLANGARVGIYVPGPFTDELFRDRGTVSARFGTSTDGAGIAAFRNDRLPAVSPRMDDVAKKLYWGKSLKVQVRVLSSYGQGFPPGNPGSAIYTNNTFWPARSAGAVSELAEEMLDSFSSSLTATAAYGGAFVSGDTDFGAYVTHLTWDDAGEAWTVTRRSGETEPLGDRQLVVYYAEPAFITVENNTSGTLTLSSLTLGGRSVVNTDTQAGYGFVFARNGAIRSALLPVSASDLVLAPGGAVQLLIPGGCGQAYALEGAFDSSLGSVRLRRTGMAEEAVSASGPFTLSGSVPAGAGSSYGIVFGEDRVICKITDAHLFTRISDAIAFAAAQGMKTAEIEMLVDYLLPASDPVTIPQGFSITLTTANKPGDVYRYDATGDRATISRDSENKASMVSVPAGDVNTCLTLRDLIFDGKSVRGNSDGGAVNAKFCKVVAERVDFINVYAANGGAIFVDDYNNGAKGKANSQVEARDCLFLRCSSAKGTGSRQGGGAIHAFSDNLILENCVFDSCDAYDQAGAVFHRVDGNYASSTLITGCTFDNCTAKAAGGLELDSKNIQVSDCVFRHCIATDRNGGGFNVYALNNANPTNDCSVTVTRCSFDDCRTTNLKSGERYGGGFRCNATHTYVYDCTFTRTMGYRGGALAVSNTNAKEAVIQGCTISGGEAYQQGGGVYSRALNTELRDTVIRNCTAGLAGGGLYVDRNAANTVLTVTGGEISGSSTTGNSGGGIYTNVRSVTVTGTRIADNTAKLNGGGVCVDLSGASYRLTLDGCTVSGNSAGGMGGGVYTKTQLTLRGDTLITGNRLTSGDAANAAGVYLPNDRTLTVGAEGADRPDGTSVRENYASGAASDLRLWESGGVNKNTSVLVNCGLNGEIYVVNANKVGTQFGSSVTARPAGFSDNDSVFKADGSTLHGIVDRTDASGKKIIWAGPPVCKITDGNDRLLYLKPNGTDPAIFDRLDDGSTSSRTSAFSLLRAAAPELYLEDGTPYTGGEYKVKMLVESYTSGSGLRTNYAAGRKITFTTAGAGDTDGHPYTGRPGTRATVIRGAAVGDKSFLITGADLELQSIILDGGSETGAAAGANTRLLYGDNDKITVTLGRNSTLQNAALTGSGAGVYMQKGALRMEGGVIRNCSAEGSGGGVYMGSGKTFTLADGNILQCSAGDGGGICLANGSLLMTGGSIDRNRASGSGGGVYAAAGRSMSMTGGYILSNRAEVKGGGIAAGGDSVRLSFSGKPTVSGNTCAASSAQGGLCNLELDLDSNLIINSLGLFNGANIGVYVPGTMDTEHPENETAPYSDHGGEGDPFGSFPDGTNTATLYGFVNDRNGLKGGLVSGGAPNTIYWIKIFSLEVSKDLVLSENIPEEARAAALAESFPFRVRIWGSSSDGVTKAGDIDGEYGGMIFTPIDALHTTAEFTLRAGESLTAENLPAGVSYEVQELLTEEQQKRYAAVSASLFSGVVGENARPDVPEAQWYVSVTSFTNLHPVCKLTDSSGALLYRRVDGRNIPAVYAELSEAFAALSETLYTGGEPTAPSFNGANPCRIEMLAPEYTIPAGLTLPAGKTVTLTTASPSAARFPYGEGSGAAVLRRGYDGDALIDTAGDLTLQNIVLDGDKARHTCTGDGGLLKVENGGRLSIRSGAVLQNAHAQGSGGAVYAAPGSRIAVTGGAVKQNACAGRGAGVCLEAGSTLSLSGSPDFGGPGTDPFGGLTGGAGNLLDGSLTAQTNGGKTYARARQDVYIAEDGDAPASIRLTGDLDMAPGSLWVWAESEKHYAMMSPFAVLDTAGVSAATYQCFRNARADSLTLCGGDGYLTGATGPEPAFIYWSGGFDVRFRKTDGFGEALAGAEFSLYKDYGCSIPASVTVDRVRADTVLSKGEDETAEDGTLFNVSFNIAPGVYYMKELTAPENCLPNEYVYQLTVGPAAPGEPDWTMVRLEAGAASPVPDPLGPDIARYGILNISARARRAVLKKIDSAYLPLPGAKFDVLRWDRTPVDTDCVSGAAGCFWIGDLPYGVYYLHETVTPAAVLQNPGGWWYVLTVSASGVTCSLQKPAEP